MLRFLVLFLLEMLVVFWAGALGLQSSAATNYCYDRLKQSCYELQYTPCSSGDRLLTEAEYRRCRPTQAATSSSTSSLSDVPPILSRLLAFANTTDPFIVIDVCVGIA